MDRFKGLSDKERCSLSDAKKYGTHYKLIKFCNGQCHCCSDTIECYLLKGGVEDGEDDKTIKNDIQTDSIH